MTEKQLKDLDYLIEKSKEVEMTADEVTAQRRSFAYGNSAFENSKITKEMVEEQARQLGL